MVPIENAKNLMDCKEIKLNSVMEADTTRSFINRIPKCQAIVFNHVMRRETRTSCDNWNY